MLTRYLGDCLLGRIMHATAAFLVENILGTHLYDVIHSPDSQNGTTLL